MLSANDEPLAVQAELSMNLREDSSGNTTIVHNDQEVSEYDWLNYFEGNFVFIYWSMSIFREKFRSY